MNTASDQTRSVVEQINEAIRENPLAAGFIGAGIAWMLFGGRDGISATMRGATERVSNAAAGAQRAGVSVIRELTETGANAASSARQKVSEVADSVASIVPEMSASDISELGSKTEQQIRHAANAGLDQARGFQTRLSRMLEQQPLLLGAAGVVIGVGIASTFAETSFEQNAMGDKADQAREKIGEVANAAKDHATHVLSEVQDEAERQGLTIDGAREAATAMGEKISGIAQVTRESFEGLGSSPIRKPTPGA